MNDFFFFFFFVDSLFTVGKLPLENTVNKQVLPQAPSPTMTSFLLISDMIEKLSDWNVQLYLKSKGFMEFTLFFLMCRKEKDTGGTKFLFFFIPSPIR